MQTKYANACQIWLCSNRNSFGICMSHMVKPIQSVIPAYNNTKYVHPDLYKIRDKNVKDKIEKVFKSDPKKIVDILV